MLLYIASYDDYLLLDMWWGASSHRVLCCHMQHGNDWVTIDWHKYPNSCVRFAIARIQSS